MALFGATIYSTIGCADGFEGNLTPSVDPHYLSTDVPDLDFSALGGSASLEVEAFGTSWTASCTSDWISYTPSSGSSSATMTVTAAPNTKYSSNGRVGVITLFGTENVSSKSVTVYQESGDIVLTVNPQSVTLSATQSSTTVQVDCNTDWSFSVGENNWLTVKKDNNERLTLSALANTTGAQRSTSIAVQAGGKKTEIISVTQNAPVGPDVSVESFTFGYEGGQKSLRLDAQKAWSVQNNYSWIEVTPASGPAGTHYIYINVSRNASKQERQGSFTIDGKEINVKQSAMQLDVSPRALTLDNVGTGKSITISSNTSWRLVTTKEWLHLSKAQGSNSTTVTVSADVNNGDARECVLRLESQDGDLSETIEVTQDAGNKILTYNGINPFAAEGGKIDFTPGDLVRLSWTATIPSEFSWLHLSSMSGTSSRMITITVDANPTITERTGYFDLVFNSGEKYRVYITQMVAGISLATSEYHFFAKGGTSEEILVESEGSLNITSSASWLTYSLSGQLLNLKAQENLTGQPRSATLTFKLSGTSIQASINVTQAGQHGDFSVSDYDSDINMSPSGGYVDLGLSVKWATCNLGADKPEDVGNYYAWGETTGYNGAFHTFDWSTYQWMQAGKNDWHYVTKYTFADGQTSACWYNSNGVYIGTTVNGSTYKTLTRLEAEDDAATTALGNNWRMPTQTECDELMKNCEWTWDSTKKGYKVTSKKSGYTNNYIFLPAGGYVSSKVTDIGISGYFWSCDLSPDYSDCGVTLKFTSTSTEVNASSNRFIGRNIRAVKIK